MIDQFLQLRLSTTLIRNYKMDLTNNNTNFCVQYSFAIYMYMACIYLTCFQRAQNTKR